EVMYDKVGMSRTKEGLAEARKQIVALREEFNEGVIIPGSDKGFNKMLEIAGRLADFLELAELMTIDASDREESCGGHFREEYQTPEGEALRDDENYTYVA